MEERFAALRLKNQLCFPLYAVSNLITRKYKPLLDRLDLTYTQYIVMMVLWERDNLLVSDITRRLKLDTNTVTPLLQRMEREGLIVRTRGIADGRQTLVSLTHKGKRLEEEAKDVPSCMVGLLAGSQCDAEQLTSAVAMLDALIAELTPQTEKIRCAQQ